MLKKSCNLLISWTESQTTSTSTSKIKHKISSAPLPTTRKKQFRRVFSHQPVTHRLNWDACSVLIQKWRGCFKKNNHLIQTMWKQWVPSKSSLTLSILRIAGTRCLWWLKRTKWFLRMNTDTGVGSRLLESAHTRIRIWRKGSLTVVRDFIQLGNLNRYLTRRI